MEFIYWMETFDRIVTLPLMAAKFLWLCRINKLPATLNEVSRDFGIRPKNILNELSETDSYIPPLTTIDYIHRISFQLNLPDRIKNRALHLVSEVTSLDGTSPILKACCNVVRAAQLFGYDLSASRAALALGISAVGVRLALKRLKSARIRRHL